MSSFSLLVNVINNNSKQWKEDIISAIFELMVTQAIRRIPIPLNGQTDRAIWRFSRTDTYNVKSGYIVAHKNPSTDNPNPDIASSLWKHL